MLWNNFVSLFVESAPWLLLGYAIAVALKYLLPQAWLLKHLGNERASTTIKAAFIGAPLPLCSCGVIPAALGLRRAGASKSATTAFLIATPETGVDSVAISYALLGPIMAIVRPIAAICSAIVAGLLVGKGEKVQRAKTNNAVASSCCSIKAVPEKVNLNSSCCSTQAKKTSDCCSSKPASTTRLIRLPYFSTLIELLQDSYRWLLLGLGFAALIQTFVPTDFLQQWGQGILGMLLMVVIGVPMYICATASTPVAAGLVMAGVSPGAALVFMLAGPATNVATLMIVKQELGGRALAAYLIGVIGCAIGFGLGLDAIMGAMEWQLNLSHIAQHQHASIWAVGLAVALAGLMLFAFRKDVLKWKSTTAKP